MLGITSDFCSVMYAKTREEAEGIAGAMISAKPEILSLDAAIPDLCYYDSSVGHRFSGLNVDILREEVSDPLAFMVKRLQDAGLTVLAGVRMNDHHGFEYMWTPWEREHKEWSLGKDTGGRGWQDIGRLRQMDYAIEGVREHRLAIIREIVEKYDVDGIQMDFSRAVPFLSEPKRKKAKFLTQYLKDVRKVLTDVPRRAGRRRRILGAIVPWDIDYCEGEGLDVRRWIKGGLVAHICPAEFYYSEWNMPVGLWRKITQGTSCKLLPAAHGNVAPTEDWENGAMPLLRDNGRLDGPKIRALAETFHGQGADGIMFYNFYVRKPPERAESFGKYYPLLPTWTDLAEIPKMSRHYFFCRRLKCEHTENYTFSPHGAFERFVLEKPGDEIEYPFRFAGLQAGSSATFRFKLKSMTESDGVSVELNGRPFDADRICVQDYRPENGPAYRVAIWEAKDSRPLLKSGLNKVRVKLLKCDSGRAESLEVGEFEILVEPEERESNR